MVGVSCARGTWLWYHAPCRDAEPQCDQKVNNELRLYRYLSSEERSIEMKPAAIEKKKKSIASLMGSSIALTVSG